MDRDAIARRQRRRQIDEARDEEQRRERALAEHLEELVTEREGARVDSEAFSRMEPEDVALVREAVGAPSGFEPEDDGEPDEPGDDAELEAEAEIARLQREIAESQRRQLAYTRYLDALDA